MSRAWFDEIVNAAGALGGGLAGWVAFEWLLGRGFLAPFVPGLLVGLGGSIWARRRSNTRGAVCGLGALMLGLVLVWRNILVPAIPDERFGTFLMHLHRLPAWDLLLIGLGGAIAFWVGRDHFGYRDASSATPTAASR